MNNDCDKIVDQKNSSIVECPAKGCAFQGKIGQVLGHIGGEKDESHSNFDVMECPVDDCSYSGTIDSVGGHINATHDDKHIPELLVETPPFRIVK